MSGKPLPTPPPKRNSVTTDSPAGSPVAPPKTAPVPPPKAGPATPTATKKVDLPDDERFEDESGYKGAAKIDLQTSLAMDKDDESLNRWKQSLLAGTAASATSDPRHVIVENLTILPEGRPAIVLPVHDDAARAKAKDTVIVFKEGCKYRLRVVFRVQHDIVMGLKFVNLVYRMGVRVDKGQRMIGSFGPQATAHEWTFDEEEAPDGFFKRGHYTAKCRFLDDDENLHSEFEYQFDIAKDW